MCVYTGYKCSVDLIFCYIRSMSMCVEILSSAHHSANTYIISFAILNIKRFGCLLGSVIQEKNHRLKGTREFNFLNSRPEIHIIHLSKKKKRNQVYKNLTGQGSETAGLGKEKRVGEILLRLDRAGVESTVKVQHQLSTCT